MSLTSYVVNAYSFGNSTCGAQPSSFIEGIALNTCFPSANSTFVLFSSLSPIVGGFFNVTWAEYSDAHCSQKKGIVFSRRLSTSCRRISGSTYGISTLRTGYTAPTGEGFLQDYFVSATALSPSQRPTTSPTTLPTPIPTAGSPTTLPTPIPTAGVPVAGKIPTVAPTAIPSAKPQTQQPTLGICSANPSYYLWTSVSATCYTYNGNSYISTCSGGVYTKSSYVGSSCAGNAVTVLNLNTQTCTAPPTQIHRNISSLSPVPPLVLGSAATSTCIAGPPVAAPPPAQKHRHKKHMQEAAVSAVMYGILLGFWGLSTFAMLTNMCSSQQKHVNGRAESNYLSSMTDVEYAEHLFNLPSQPYSGIADPDPAAPATFAAMWKDFVKLAMNEGRLSGMFFADELNNYSAWERSSTYFIVHAFGFILFAAFTAPTIEPTTQTIISVFFVSPFTMMLERFLRFILALPCCIRGRSVTFWDRCGDCLGNFITGLFFIVGCILVGVGAEIMVRTTGKNGKVYFRSYKESWDCVGNWVWSVLMISTLMELMFFAIMFIDTESCCVFKFLDMGTCGMLGIGAWHKHRRKVTQDSASKQSEVEAEAGVQKLDYALPQQQPSQSYPLPLPPPQQSAVMYAQPPQQPAVMYAQLPQQQVMYAQPPQQGVVYGASPPPPPQVMMVQTAGGAQYQAVPGPPPPQYQQVMYATAPQQQQQQQFMAAGTVISVQPAHYSAVPTNSSSHHV